VSLTTRAATASASCSATGGRPRRGTGRCSRTRRPPTNRSAMPSPTAPMRGRRLKLQAQPKSIPLMQFSRLTRPATNIGLSNNHAPALASSKAAMLPGKVTNLPTKTNHNTNVTSLHGKNQFHDSGAPRRFGGGTGGNSGPRFSSQSRSSVRNRWATAAASGTDVDLSDQLGEQVGVDVAA